MNPVTNNSGLYPLLFEPVFKSRIWGGRRLERFGFALPEGDIGEAWDISCRKDEMAVVSNGCLAGRTLFECIKQSDVLLLGEDFAQKEFGLLVKLIDANSNLSIQVHPGDVYARRVEGVPFGKSEMWYILDCLENAELYAGLKTSVAKEDFIDSLQNGTVLDCVSPVKIKRGDIISIPPGTVHAITSGVIALEIQQNSDVTYRVFDYGRLENGKPRELHTDKSLEVIDFDAANKPPVESEKSNLVTDFDSFSVFRHTVNGSLEMTSDRRKYQLISCVAGSCVIQSGEDETNLHYGRTALLPAYLGCFTIKGNCEVLITAPK